MRIGIDLSALSNTVAGIGNYCIQLVKGIYALDKENEYFLFAPTDIDVPVELNDKWHFINYGGTLKFMTALPGILKKNKIDDLVFVLGGGAWDGFIERFEKEFGVDVNVFESVNIVSNSKYPILLSAGSEENLDDLLESIKNANPNNTEVIILPGCNHGNGMYKQTELYQKAIKEFINNLIWQDLEL